MEVVQKVVQMTDKKEEAPSFDEMGYAGVVIINFINAQKERKEKKNYLKANVCGIIANVNLTDDEKKGIIQEVIIELFSKKKDKI
jgi:hypothetical protein